MVSRGDLMLVLHSLTSLELKASYALPFKSAILTAPTLHTVDTQVQAHPGSPIQATAVEVEPTASRFQLNILMFPDTCNARRPLP